MIVKVKAIVIVMMLIMIGLLIRVPSKAVATDPEPSLDMSYMLWSEGTLYFPPFYGNPAYDQMRGRSSTMIADNYDSTWGTVYGSGTLTTSLATGAFLPSPYYWEGSPDNESWEMNFISVKVVAFIHSELMHDVWGYHYGNPNCTLSYSLDALTTWHTSTMFAKNTGGEYTTNGVIFDAWEVSWNVTAEETWTASMITSPQTRTVLTTYQDEDSFYDVDYIGFELWWNFTTGIPWNNTENAFNRWGGNATYAISIIGIMGLVGFIGMIATPPACVFYIRRGEGRLRTFVLMLTLGMFSFTMFMGSLNA